AVHVGLQQEFDLAVLKETQQEQRRKVARSAREHIVLELPQDLRVRPAESLRKLERGLPVTFFERLRSGHARGVAYKKRIGEISSAAIQEQERTKPLDVGILAH